MSEHDRSRTPTRELCIFSFANFAYALSLAAPPQSGGPDLTPLDHVLCTPLGGGGLKLKADSRKLTAHESKSLPHFTISSTRTYTIHPGPYPVPFPRSKPNSFRSRTLHTFWGRGIPFSYLLLAVWLALPTLCFAQTMVAKTITFTGAPQSQAELLTLSGLKPGATLTKDDIDAAANRLDASGLFSSVQYSTAPGILTFTLEPSAKAQMERVRYQNFVWYTQKELNDAVHARLPLFTGSVPGNGPLKDQVAQTLVAILKERGIDATVDSEGVAGGQFEYRIVSPPIVVSDLQIENIRWDSDPVLDSVRHALINVEYLEGLSQTGVHENLSYALKELGFLDETVGPIAHGEPKLEAGRIGVVMTGAATPGSRYKVAHVTLPALVGTVTAGDLESEHQVKPGGLPSPSLVRNTVARMAFVFQGHGFLDAKSSVDSSQDSAAHTMSYTFTVAPGLVYHMRDLLFAADLNADQKAQLTQAWNLPKGAVYEREPVERTLLLSLKTLCAGHPASEKLIPDQATHQVDVSLSCKPQR